jgi:hypothetical protein
MSKVVNNRRAATSSVAVLATKNSTAYEGVALRTAMSSSLSIQDLKNLDDFKTKEGDTEKNKYLVFMCTLSYKGGRISVETDTPPPLVVQGFTSAENLLPDIFYLPLPVLEKKEWQETLPRFNKWLVSTSRYPVCDESTKTVSRNSQVREISKLDTIEMYYAAYFATMNEYLASGDIKYAKNCWMLARVIDITTRELCPLQDTPIMTLLEQTDVFKKLVMQRDASYNGAVAYKKFVSELNPAHYYWMLYQLMLDCPEIMHKSYLTRYDFIPGLGTQQSLGKIGCTYAGINDSLIPLVPKRKLTEFVDKQTLVEYVHKTVGKEFIDGLKYWAQMIAVVRSTLLDRPLSQKEFTGRVQIIRTNFQQLQGITSFCLSICPDAARYLNDDVLAELIVSMSQADKSFSKNTILTTAALMSTTSTPLLDRIIQTNATRVSKLQSELKEPLDTNKEVVDSWNCLLRDAGCEKGNEIHSGGAYNTLRKRIITYAKRGDDFSLRCLNQLLEEGYDIKPPLIGQQRARALILRAADVGSDVFNHFMGELNEKVVEDIKRNFPKDYLGTLLRDITRDISHVSFDDVSDAAVQQPVEFTEYIKFERARQLVVETENRIQQEIDAILRECYICFGDHPKNMMVTLHNDSRHEVCQTCRPQLHSCPFCRATL